MSVRFRVTVLATVATVAVLALTGIGLVVMQRRQLTEDLDDTIRAHAGELVALVESGELPPTISPQGDDDTVAQVVTLDGQVLAASANLEGEGPVSRERGEGFRTVDDLPVDDEDFRLLTRPLQAAGEPGVVHVAASLDDISESVDTLVATLVAAIPLAAAVLAALTWWLVGRTLRSVEAIRAEVAGIGGDELHRRVPEPSGHDEIGRLARTMNDMLGRLQAAAERQRRFVADASHELRTPLARMRTELEVDAAHPETADDAETRSSVLSEVLGLQRLADDLLVMARSDAPGDDAHRRLVDLDDIVSREASRIRAETAGAVDASQVSGAQVMGDPTQLTRVVRNLLDNAARHTRTTITLTLAERDGTAELAVADDGPGIAPGDHERAFERFTRLDDARAAVAGGAGLGLAITREIVERHGGTVAIDAGHWPGTRVVVRLPAAS